MTLIKPHKSNLLRWSCDSDMESLSILAKKNPDTPGINFARHMLKAPEERVGKDSARGKIIARLTGKVWTEDLRIFTMPGIFWHFEKSLLKNRFYLKAPGRRVTTIVSVEREPTIYAASLKYIPGGHKFIRHYTDEATDYAAAVLKTASIKRFYCCTFEKFVQHNPMEFDVAWLDFTGPLTTELLDAIPAFWPRVGKLLVVTALNARWANNVDRLLKKHDGPFNLLKHICKDSEFDSEFGNVQDDSRLTYMDSVPMFQVVLRRRQR